MPVVGATLSVAGGASTTSDGDGYFTLSSIAAGAQVLNIDATTAQAAPNGAPYAGYAESIQLIAGVANSRPEPFYLGRIDSTTGTPVDPDQQTVVTSSALGVTVTIPAGSAALDGNPFVGDITISGMPTSVDLSVLPEFFSPCELVAVQPFGVRFDPPATITLPNLDSLPAGSEVDIWQLDPTTGAFSVVGVGQVNTGGANITTISGGITAGGLFAAVPPAPVLSASADYNDSFVIPSALNDGNLTRSYTLPSYLTLGEEVSRTLVYNSRTAAPQPIISAEATLLARAGLPAALASALEVGGINVAGPVYTSTSAGAAAGDAALSETQDETIRQALTFDAGQLPSGSHAFRFSATARYACSRVAGEFTGQVVVNNQAASPLGAGWTLLELQRLTVQEDRIVINEGDGSTLAFTPNPASGTTISHGFDAGTDGWQVVGDADAPIFNPTGGNPGGYIRAIDRVEGDIWRFSAPADFVAKLADAYNDALRYDLITTRPGSGGVTDDVVLTGGGLSLAYNTPNPTTTWQAFTVPLNEAAGWVISGTTQAPTHDQFRSVLAGLSQLTIRGEYFSGGDNAGLDNVRVSDADEGETLIADYLSPAADFSELYRNADGTFVRRMKDGTEYRFDAQGRMTAMADRNGNTTSYAYNTAGDIQTITDPTGQVTSLAYAGERLSEVTDPAGRTTRFAQDAAGNLTRIDDADGSSVSYAYDSRHRLTRSTDQRGFATTNAYGFAGQYLGSGRPDGTSVAVAASRMLGLANLGISLGTEANPMSYTRTGDQTATLTTPAGQLLTLKLNSFGSPVKITDSLDRTTRLTRDANDLVVEVEVPNEGEVPPPEERAWLDFLISTAHAQEAAKPISKNSFGRDRKGNITVQKEAVGTPLERQTTFVYEPTFNQVTEIVDPAGARTRFTYNAKGNLTKIVDANGGEQVFTYDARGRRLTARDQNGRTTRYTYDANGNLATVKDAYGTETVYDRDDAGNVVRREVGRIVIGETRVTEYGYDARNRLLTLRDAESGLSQFAYDEAGNRIAVTDPKGLTKTRSYDALDRLTETSDLASGTVRWTRDANGSILAMADPLGNVWRYEYDDANRLVTIVDPDAHIRSFAYDVQDNLTRVTDAVGNQTIFAYDVLNRRIRRTDAAGGLWRFVYDSRDNLVRTTDARGQVLRRSFDALSRLSRVETPDNLLTYSYDPVGNLLTAADNDSNLAFSYDAVNRLSAARTLAGGLQPLVTLTPLYDDFERIELLNDVEPSPDGETQARIEFAHDGLGRLTGVFKAEGGDVSLAYEPNGQLRTLQFANGISAELDYEPSGRLERLSYMLSGIDEFDQPLTIEILDATYDYDAAGDITAIDEGPGQIRGFAYDALKRLTSAGTSLESESYDYDPQGNRTVSHLSALHMTSADNRLVEDEQFTYGYDANGNLTTKTEELTGLVTTYGWNAQNQLVRINFPDDGYAAYRYDALGRRIEKDVDGVIVHYVYDGPDIVFEFDASGGTDRLTATYDHGLSTDQPLMLHRAFAIDPDDGGGIGFETFYYQADQQGSIRKITDANGTVVNSYEYDAYGNISSSAEGVPQPFAYTGREYDAESGLYYYRARYYDPTTGRFLSEDPLRLLSGDLNLYRYVLDDPVNLVDPSGLAPRPRARAAGGAAAEYATLASNALFVTTAIVAATQALNATFDGIQRLLNDRRGSLLSGTSPAAISAGQPNPGNNDDDGDEDECRGGSGQSFDPNKDPLEGMQSGTLDTSMEDQQLYNSLETADRIKGRPDQLHNKPDSCSKSQRAAEGTRFLGRMLDFVVDLISNAGR